MDFWRSRSRDRDSTSNIKENTIRPGPRVERLALEEQRSPRARGQLPEQGQEGLQNFRALGITMRLIGLISAEALRASNGYLGMCGRHTWPLLISNCRGTRRSHRPPGRSEDS